MAFIIKNIDTVNINIDDLGIFLAPGDTYDLIQDQGHTVAQSQNLKDAISGGSIQVLDPLDDVTPLSTSNALAAVNTMNDPHFRIKGGFIDQLGDVNTSGKTGNELLYYNNSSGNFEPLTVADGTSITTNIAGGTLTITNDDPNIDQNIWETITADSGSTTANTTTDTLNVVGGTGITTSITGDTLTISAGAAANSFGVVTGDTGTANADTPNDTINIVGGNKITTTAGDTPDTLTIDWGSLTLAELTDVAVGSPVGNNYNLKYSATLGKWYPAASTPPPPSGTEFSIQLLWGPITRYVGTTEIPKDTSPPLITEGTQIWARTMTLQDINSTVRIATNVTFSASTTSLSLIMAAFRGSTCVGVAVNSTANKSEGFALSMEIYDAPGSVGPHTYSMRVGKTAGTSGTWYVNGIHNNTPTIYFVSTGSPQIPLMTRNSYTLEEIGGVT